MPPTERQPATGPLRGLTVIELGGMGPGPFAGMTLAELGADVIKVEREGGNVEFPGRPEDDLTNRGKRSIVLDLKDPADRDRALELIARADVLIEGFRPGVTERLGLGPDECLARNPRLVYGRMTGWGQDGPEALRAGHDLPYVAVTGALHAIGEQDGPPIPPLNLLGDYGGGGLYLIVGVLAALREVALTGRGQVVDAAIVDGVAHLLTGTHAFLATGSWEDRRGVNVLSGIAPYNAVYRTSDDEYMAVGAIEQRFYSAVIDGLGIDIDPREQHDRSRWDAHRAAIAGAFASRTQREWTDVFARSEACVAPVLSLRGAAEHPQLRHRGTLVVEDGVLQAAPAPRFSVSSTSLGSPPPRVGEHTSEVLAEFGLSATATPAPAGEPAPEPRVSTEGED